VFFNWTSWTNFSFIFSNFLQNHSFLKQNAVIVGAGFTPALFCGIRNNGQPQGLPLQNPEL